jgi:hypothetical protein
MADRSPEVVIDVDVTIGTASTGSSAEIASRALDRPNGPADILNHKFDLMSEKPEDRAVQEIPILFFEHRKLMSDAPHGLGRCIEKEPEPSRMESDGGFCGITFWLHGLFMRVYENYDELGARHHRATMTGGVRCDLQSSHFRPRAYRHIFRKPVRVAELIEAVRAVLATP